MRPQEIIQKKRDGESLSEAEINYFIKGVTTETWADYQTSALIMAMFLNGLNLAEQNALTRAMLVSGEQLDFSDLDAPVADKHSTGGVGDKTSLIIAPVVAACGVSVPMISGRGLGHTGGTLDKLESIAGFNVNLSVEEFKKTIKKCGYAMAGQTKTLVPADRKLYALRDATATVASVPLIVASIMSKKMAEDLDALVLDVKTGSGAFMRESSDAKRLAEALCETGKAFNVRCEAVISDMNQPLGKFVGNALEVYECVKIMRGETDAAMQPTLDLSVELAARMLVLCGVAETVQSSKRKVQSVLDSGAALEKFRENIECQNGDATICDAPKKLLEENALKIEVRAAQNGFVSEIETNVIGECISKIGGGRIRVEDKIDFAVGYECVKMLGDETSEGEPLGVIYCRDAAQADSISESLRNAYKIASEKPIQNNLVEKIIG